MARVSIRALPEDRIPDVESIAKAIVTDAFWVQRKWPDQIVDSKLPIPMAKGSRKRVARKFNLAVDNHFHSLYDKAIHRIRQETQDGL